MSFRKRSHNNRIANPAFSGNGGVEWITSVLLLLNLILLIVLIARVVDVSPNGVYNLDLIPTTEKGEKNLGARPVEPSEIRDFLSIAEKTGSDKVQAHFYLQDCLLDDDTGRLPQCVRPGCVREKCRPVGHFYDTFYQRWLGRTLSRDDAPPFRFVEIGFYKGNGMEAFGQFFPRGEGHSIEISCIESGPRSEGKWPWGNFASESNNYQNLLNQKRLHCGDASDIDYLDKVWNVDMNRPDAPPLKLVIDDASHLAYHMVTTIFYWFPKIAPRGFLVIEDIQPLLEINKFRAQFLPQIVSDLHYCGDPAFPEEAFFPTLWPLLASISCEMHVCVFERNDEPANLDLPPDKLRAPEYALDYRKAISVTREKTKQ